MSLSLLLVGRDGNGKSSTGNSILGAKLFTPTSNFLSDGVEIISKQASVLEKNVYVTEIAGLEYPGSDQSENIEKTLKDIEETIEKNTNGFSAVVFVMKYGIRFTKQEKDCLLMIKSIFGANVIKDFGVIVMTFGDSFELDAEEDKQTFEEWCSAQTGDVRTLFEHCGNRCVLFNNRTKKIEAQREKLFSMVAKIDHPYTIDEYKKAVKNQTEILVESKLPKYEEIKKRTMGHIWSQLNLIHQEYSHGCLDIGDYVLFLYSLEQNLLHLKKTFLDDDKNTGILKRLLFDVPIAEMRIGTQLQMAEKRLLVKPSEAKWFILSEDLQSTTETLDIRKCSIDGAGNFTSSSVSDVSGCYIVLVEISKMTSKSQQVIKTLDLHVEYSCGEMVTDVNNDSEQVNSEAQGRDSQPFAIQGHDSKTNENLGHVSKANKDLGHDSKANKDLGHESKAYKDLGHDSKANKDLGHESKANENLGHESKANKDLGLESKANKDLGHDSKANENLGHDSKANKDLGHDSKANEDLGHDSKANKDLGHDSKANEDLGHDSKANENGRDSKANENLGHDSKANKDLGHDSKANENLDHDSKAIEVLEDTWVVVQGPSHDSEILDHDNPNYALENIKVVFKTINNILKQYNHNNIICLISKYEQTLTKQEVDDLMKKIKATCGTKEVTDQSILILICDHDNLEIGYNEMVEKWRKEETNQHLLRACGNRCVLLNPWVEDEGTLVAQKLRFLTYIHSAAGSFMENSSKKSQNVS